MNERKSTLCVYLSLETGAVHQRHLGADDMQDPVRGAGLPDHASVV